VKVIVSLITFLPACQQPFLTSFFLLNAAKEKHSDKNQEAASYEVARGIVASAGKRVPAVHN
jgi:hypothetical protein